MKQLELKLFLEIPLTPIYDHVRVFTIHGSENIKEWLEISDLEKKILRNN